MEVKSITITNKIETTKLKELRDIISELDICEQAEILKIIEKNKIKFRNNEQRLIKRGNS